MLLDKEFTEELSQYSTRLSDLIKRIATLEKACLTVKRQYPDIYEGTPDYEEIEECCESLFTTLSLLQSANQTLTQVTKSDWKDYVREK